MDFRVVPEICLAGDEDDGNVRAEVVDFGHPALADVLEGVAVVDGVAHEEDVGVGVGQGTEAVVVLLTRRVPQCQVHCLLCHLGRKRKTIGLKWHIFHTFRGNCVSKY